MLVLLDSKSRITVCPPLTDAPLAASADAPLSKNVEHVLQARARLIIQYETKPRVDALLCVYVDQIQLLEDALWQLQTLRTIDLGEGVQLDGIGEIVGQERQGLSDADYRPLLRARVRANRSSGTVPDLIAVACAALDNPPPGSFKVEPLFPASFEIRITDPTPFDPEILNDLIQDATMAGVRAIVIVTYTASAANRFVFADHGVLDNKFEAAAGFGAGEFSTALDHET